MVGAQPTKVSSSPAAGGLAAPACHRRRPIAGHPWPAASRNARRPSASPDKLKAPRPLVSQVEFARWEEVGADGPSARKRSASPRRARTCARPGRVNLRGKLASKAAISSMAPAQAPATPAPRPSRAPIGRQFAASARGRAPRRSGRSAPMRGGGKGQGDSGEEKGSYHGRSDARQIRPSLGDVGALR